MAQAKKLMVAPATKAITVIDGDGTIDATDAPVITAAEVTVADTVMRNLAMNFLAGVVSQDIIDANSGKGGLGAAFPLMTQANKQAIRKLITLKPSVIRDAWANKQLTAKRKSKVGLQGLAVACSPKTPPTEGFKEKVLAWALDHKAEVLKLPLGLYDIIADIMPDEKSN